MRLNVCVLKSVFVLMLVIAPITNAQNSLVFDSPAEEVDYALWSSLGGEQLVADRFQLDDNYQLEEVTWRGLYYSGDPNAPLVDDNFAIQIYGGDDRGPFVDAYTTDNVGEVSRVATGETVLMTSSLFPPGEYDVYEYSASFSTLGLREGTDYWLSISNDSPSLWSWGIDWGPGQLRMNQATTWGNGYLPAFADFSLFGSTIDLPTGTTSKWTSTDGFFDNPQNWDTGFTPVNAISGDKWNAVIDSQASAPIQVRMRTAAQLENLTLDSQIASFLVDNETLTINGNLKVNQGLFRVGWREGFLAGAPDRGSAIVSGSFENHGQVEIVEASLELLFDAQFVQHEGSLVLEHGIVSNHNTNSMRFLGGSLEGRGDIFSDVDFAGTLEIGMSDGRGGRIAVSGDWTFLPTAESEVRLDSNFIQRDFLVGGSLVLDGILTFEMINGFDQLVQSGDEITIMRGTTILGEFLNVSNGGLLTSADGLSSFTVHYGSDSIFDSNLVVLSNFAAVPEPSALIGGWLLLAFCGIRRRRS